MAEIPAYVPNDAEQIQARLGYLNYLTGAAILHDPEATQAIHRRNPENESGVRLIMVYADRLMLEGLRSVIRNANPSEIRENLAKQVDNFDQALPLMQATIFDTFTHEAESIRKLGLEDNPLRPAPMTEKIVYGYICHPHLDKLTSLRLVWPLLPADIFAPYLHTRTLEYLNKREAESAYLQALEAS